MTYKDDIHNKLIEEGIFIKQRVNRKIDKWDYVFLDRWFYQTLELFLRIKDWSLDFKNYSKFPNDFLRFTNVTTLQALRYNIIFKNDIIHIKKWFYDKELILDFLEKKLWQ